MKSSPPESDSEPELDPPSVPDSADLPEAAAENQEEKKKKKRSVPARVFRALIAIVLILLAIPLLGVGALLAYPFRIDLDRWADEIDRELTQLFGREITIEEGLSLVTGTRPSLEVRGLVIDNPSDWATGGTFARLDRFQTTLGLRELFEQEIAIDDILVEGLRLKLERSSEGTGNWEDLATSLVPSETGDSDSGADTGFNLSSTGFEHIQIEDIHVLTVRRDQGPTAPQRPLFLEKLEGSAPAGGSIAFHVEGILKGLPFECDCEGGPLDTLVNREEPWPAIFRGKLGQTRFEIQGERFTEGFKTPGVLRFDVEIPEVEELFPLTGDLPPIGSLQLQGVAERSARNLFDLPTLSGTLGDSPVQGSASLDLSGDIPLVEGSLALDFVHLDLFRKSEIVADAEAEIVSDDSSPGPGPRKAAMRRSEATSLPFHGNLRLQIGEILGIESPATIRDLDLRAEIFEEIVTAELTAEFAEMELEGRLDITGERDENVLFALDLQGGEAELTELFAHYLKHEKFQGRLESVHYRIEGQGTNLAEAWDDRSVLLAVTNADVSYPFFGREYRFFVEEGSVVHHSGPSAVVLLAGDYRKAPFDARFELVESAEESDKRIRIREASGRFADIEVAVSNLQLDKPFSPEDVRFRFELSGDRLDKLDHVYELNLPPYGPYSSRGIYHQVPGSLSLEEFELTVGSSQLNGSAQFETRENGLHVEMDLSSPTIQLDDFSTPDWSPVADGSRKSEGGFADLVSHEALSAFNGVVRIDVGQVLSGRDRLGSGSVTARFDDSRLTLSPLVLGIPGGEFRGDGLFHPRSNGTLDWQFDLAARNFDVGVISRRRDPDSVFRGFANIDVKVEARGVPYGKPHLKEATGTLDLDFCPENLDSGSMDVWVQNLVLLLLPRLDPDNRSTVNCILGRLELKDGLITTDTLGMDTTTMRVAAEGEIDLVKETLALKLNPVPKRPQIFSLQVPVAIEGTLTEPEFVMGRRPALRALAHLTKNTLLFPASFLTSRRLPADGSDICTCRRRQE